MARHDRTATARPSAGSSARCAYGAGRVTAPRAIIAAVVAGLSDAFTVEELVEAVRRADQRFASTATVYRAVAAMNAAGFLERVGTRGGCALYARCAAAAHHHHIVCDGCGRTVEAVCPLGPEVAAGAAEHGFTITRHEVTIYGLCRSCSAPEQVG